MIEDGKNHLSSRDESRRSCSFVYVLLEKKSNVAEVTGAHVCVNFRLARRVREGTLVTGGGLPYSYITPPFPPAKSAEISARLLAKPTSRRPADNLFSPICYAPPDVFSLSASC